MKYLITTLLLTFFFSFLQLSCKSDKQVDQRKTIELAKSVLDGAIVKGWQRGIFDGQTSDSIDDYFIRLSITDGYDALHFANNVHILVDQRQKIHFTQLDSINALKLY